MRKALTVLALATTTACAGTGGRVPMRSSGPAPSPQVALCTALDGLREPIGRIEQLDSNAATLVDAGRLGGALAERMAAVDTAATAVPDARLGALQEAVWTFDTVVSRQPGNTLISRASADIPGAAHNIGVAGEEARDALFCGQLCNPGQSEPPPTGEAVSCLGLR